MGIINVKRKFLSFVKHLLIKAEKVLNNATFTFSRVNATIFWQGGGTEFQTMVAAANDLPGIST
ncbi:MAG: hypothetical protein MUC87_00965 [Bacteroidia bacterium]|jgi:hypothetical protein|nr:hypothetical protein [Bacteroidia bacterium]